MKTKIKFTVLMVLLVICFVGIMATGALATQIEGIDLPDVVPGDIYHEINLEDAFNTDELQRTVTVDGQKREDIIVVEKAPIGYMVKSLADEYGAATDIFDSFEEYIVFYFENRAKDYTILYPCAETVSVNGVPWQDTEYEDVIKNEVAEILENHPNDPLGQNPDQWEVAQEPVYNGLGEEIFVDGMSLSEAAKKGKTIQQETQPLPVGKNITLKMVLDKPSYTLSTKDGKISKILEVAPFAKNGVTLVPVRGVFEAFEAKVEWLSETKEVRVTKGDQLIILKLGAPKAHVNGQEVTLLQPAQTVKGRTLIPLRFISENLGYNVTWISKTKQIVITD